MNGLRCAGGVNGQSWRLLGVNHVKWVLHMARMARISVMTTLFCFAAVDIAVPLLVLVAGVAVSEMIFSAADLLALKRRAA
jgi:hypothetical protein